MLSYLAAPLNLSKVLWWKRHKCPQCPRSYQHIKHLNAHLKYECGKEPSFKCQFCNHMVKQKSSLISHTKNHHNIDLRTFTKSKSQRSSPKQANY